ncbi:MAG: hypothetical protein FJ301_00485 [Planctomycetes bacterium]|nr:hypothetical protein [Planctomycetota bacterium]
MNAGAALALVATAALAWRAGATLVAEGARLAAPGQPTWRQRLLDPTEARIRRALGDDATLLFALQAAAPRPALVLVARPDGDPRTLTPERFKELDRRNGRIVQLQALAYPDPWLQEVADPYSVAAGLAASGRDVRVLQLAGDAPPADAAAWAAAELPGGNRLWARP